MVRDDDKALVLIVDDDRELCALVARWLELAGLRTAMCADALELADTIDTTMPDAVCLDINLPGISGLDALAAVQQRHPGIPVVMLTADDSVASVVTAMNRGAHDYLTKPLERAKLVSAMTHAVQLERTRSELARLKREAVQTSYAGILGRSANMRELFRHIDRVAARDISVLIHGESGTGKELVARAIHDNSQRARGPFIAINCAAIPESLQDSELFGHERGAFTGANQSRTGRFERAHGGTLFLDEVAELTLATQAKLLRVLQERTFERVGGGRSVQTDFRLIAATHRDLRQMVQDGKFREDLFFRIAIFDLELPALRHREGDLELLVPYLLERIAERNGGAVMRASSEVLNVLSQHSFPGNVRELENVLQRAAVLATDGVLRSQDLPAGLRAVRLGALAPPSSAQEPEALAPAAAPAQPAAALAPVQLSAAAAANDVAMDLEAVERWAIERALAHTHGQLTETAKVLGIGRTTLYRKLEKYGLR